MSVGHFLVPVSLPCLEGWGMKQGIVFFCFYVFSWLLLNNLSEQCSARPFFLPPTVYGTVKFTIQAAARMRDWALRQQLSSSLPDHWIRDNSLLIRFWKFGKDIYLWTLKMQINIHVSIPVSIVIVVVAAISTAYFRLSRALAKTNQVLALWEDIAELPFLGAHVGRIFTLFMRIRNPYSRSIGMLILRLSFN